MEPGPPPAGESWNVNMPAVIGVVFVFLLGVVIWVIASSSGGDGEGDEDAVLTVTPTATPTVTPTATPTATATATPTATATATAAPVSTVGPTTGDTTADATSTSAPAPIPATTAPGATTTPTSAPATTESPPATTAPGSQPGTVPGDLGVPGRPMLQPACDGSYITVLASPVGDQATAASLGSALDTYPGSNYLRTDQTCPSLSPSLDGEPIYVVYLGPFVVDSDACMARAEGPEGAYARRLSSELTPGHFVECP